MWALNLLRFFATNRLAGTLLLSAVAGLTLLGFIAWANHEHHAAQAAKAQVQVATKAAQIQATVAKATDDAAVRTVQIETRTHEVIRQIQAAPGADSPVPPDVLRVWRDGLREPSETPPEAHRP